jgi:hypothetical protein
MMTLFYVVTAASLLGYFVYRSLYPRPIPGIPYDAESAKRFEGDRPGLRAAYKQHGEFNPYRIGLTRKLRSPLVQVFAQPPLPPLLFMDEPREAEDILLRRNREFDRAKHSMLIIGTIMPHSSIVKKTNASWKAQRRPWMDVMSPDFLKRVVAPRLHAAGQELVELWKAKAASAHGSEVDIAHDFDTAALDAIWAAILGENLGGLRDLTNTVKGNHHSSEKNNGKELGVASSLDMQVSLFPLLRIVFGSPKIMEIDLIFRLGLSCLPPTPLKRVMINPWSSE